jgi:hypothetical protein
MKRVYCTHFDSNYLAQGLTMIESLRRVDREATVFVLALDDAAWVVLEDLSIEGVTLLEPEALAKRCPELKKAVKGRSQWAAYATGKPQLVRLVLEEAAAAWVVYVDADLWFCSSLGPIWEELGEASVGLSPHRFAPGNEGLAIYGQYNAGFVCFRADEVGRRCAEDWARDCREWCSEETLPDGRFMNQGYLNAWPRRFRGVREIAHPGVNLAPWNAGGHELGLDGAGRVVVDGSELIFYHFSGVYRDAAGEWWNRCPFEGQAGVQRQVYEPYVEEVDRQSEMLKERYGLNGFDSVRQVQLDANAMRIKPLAASELRAAE